MMGLISSLWYLSLSLSHHERRGGKVICEWWRHSDIRRWRYSVMNRQARRITPVLFHNHTHCRADTHTCCEQICVYVLHAHTWETVKHIRDTDQHVDSFTSNVFILLYVYNSIQILYDYTILPAIYLLYSI